MSVSALGNTSNRWAAAARTPAAASRMEDWHAPMDTDEDGLVTYPEAYEYKLDRPELLAAEAAGAQGAPAIQQAGAASVKAATGLDLMA